MLEFAVRILGYVALQQAARKDADVANALALWAAVVKAARWTRFIQLKADFPSADYVPPFTVFNVKGNKYRLISLIDYAEQVVVVRDVLTHATYSRGKWK
jgi:mRNA interferase HigB